MVGREQSESSGLWTVKYWALHQPILCILSFLIHAVHISLMVCSQTFLQSALAGLAIRCLSHSQAHGLSVTGRWWIIASAKYIHTAVLHASSHLYLISLNVLNSRLNTMLCTYNLWKTLDRCRGVHIQRFLVKLFEWKETDFDSHAYLHFVQDPSCITKCVKKNVGCFLSSAVVWSIWVCSGYPCQCF